MRNSNCKVNRIILLSMVCGLLSVVYCYAAFEEENIGARATGLGGACTASTDDVYAIYYNPAGLVHIPRIELSTTYGRLHLNLDDNSNIGNSFVGFAYPIRIKVPKYQDEYQNRSKTKKKNKPVKKPEVKTSTSTTTSSLEKGPEEIELNIGTMGIGWHNLNLTDLYSENSFVLAFAKDDIFTWLGKDMALMLRRLSIGVNFKLLTISYGEDPYYSRDARRGDLTLWGRPDDLFLSGRNKNTIGLDLGLQYAIASNYRIGLMIANLNQPNLAIASTDVATLPTVIKLGLKHQRDDIVFSLDTLLKQFNKSTDYRVALGAERWFKFGLAFRGSVGFGSRSYSAVSLGMGYRIGGIQFDYAVIYPFSGIQDIWGTHKVSLTARFGPMLKPKDTTEIESQLSREIAARRQAEIQVAQARMEIEKLRMELDRMLKRKVEVSPTIIESVEPGTEEKPVSPTILEPEITPKEKPEPVTPTKVPEKPKPAVKPKTKETTPVTSAQPVKSVGKEEVKVTTAVPAFPTDLGAPTTPVTVVTPVVDLQKITKEFNLSLVYYRKRVDAGSSLKERIDTIQKIIRKYKDQNINVNEAQQELDRLNSDIDKAEKDYRDSIRYYQKLVERGIGNKERIDLLNRVIEKYKDSGVNLNDAEKELKQLKQ